jgi:hypothetical protein
MTCISNLEGTTTQFPAQYMQLSHKCFLALLPEKHIYEVLLNLLHSNGLWMAFLVELSFFCTAATLFLVVSAMQGNAVTFR